jgi:hypothetical protein
LSNPVLPPVRHRLRGGAKEQLVRLILLGLAVCGVACVRAPGASAPRPELLPLQTLGSRLAAALYQSTVATTAWEDAGTLTLGIADSALRTGDPIGKAHARTIAVWAWAHYEQRPRIDRVSVLFARATPAADQFGQPESGVIYTFAAQELEP